MQCLVIGEITCDRLMVILNKTDLIEESKREAHISKVRVDSLYMYLFMCAYGHHYNHIL